MRDWRDEQRTSAPSLSARTTKQRRAAGTLKSDRGELPAHIVAIRTLSMPWVAMDRGLKAEQMCDRPVLARLSHPEGDNSK